MKLINLSFLLLFAMGLQAAEIEVQCVGTDGGSWVHFPFVEADGFAIKGHWVGSAQKFLVASDEYDFLVANCTLSAPAHLSFSHLLGYAKEASGAVSWFAQGYAIEPEEEHEHTEARRALSPMAEDISLSHDLSQDAMILAHQQRLAALDALLPIDPFVEKTLALDFLRRDFLIKDRAGTVVYRNDRAGAPLTAIQAAIETIETLLVGVPAEDALSVRKHIALALSACSQAFDAKALLLIWDELKKVPSPQANFNIENGPEWKTSVTVKGTSLRIQTDFMLHLNVVGNYGARVLSSWIGSRWFDIDVLTGEMSDENLTLDAYQMF